jgi:hypothetical protein
VVTWTIGILEAGQQDAIDVRVRIAPAVPPSDTLPIVDVIRNHLGEPAGRVDFGFHVIPPPPWKKLVDGALWHPEFELTKQYSDTFTIVETVTTTDRFTLTEAWPADKLEVTPVFKSDGQLIPGPGTLSWVVPPTPPGTSAVHTLIKEVHVKPCAWTDANLIEELHFGREQVIARPVHIKKRPPGLWIDSAPPAQKVVRGRPAGFTLTYGNDGGREPGVLIRNFFPPWAPFDSAIPAPLPGDISPDRLVVTWTIGTLDMDHGGAIAVTVLVLPDAPLGATLTITDEILNHLKMPVDLTTLHLKVVARVYLPIVLRNYP